MLFWLLPPGCNSQVGASVVPDGGCGQVYYEPGNLGGCTAPLADGGFYLPDGGINIVPDGGISRFAILIGPFERCPWWYGGVPSRCGDALGDDYCVAALGGCAPLPANADGG